MKFIGDLPIVVHDVKNERHAIITNAKFYDIQFKPLRFIDTFKLAPNMWPGETRYGLNALAERLHLSTLGEHSALVDAHLSAKVLLEMASELKVNSLPVLLEHLGFDDFGIIDKDGGQPLKQPITQLSPRQLEEWLVPNSEAPDNLFKNKVVLISGQFRKIEKEALQAAIAQRGGTVQKRPKAVANKTDIVIFSDNAKSSQSKKFVAAVYAKQHGRGDLYLMNETELNKFLDL
jgi:DNA polymerase III epsilon subunit-like protein